MTFTDATGRPVSRAVSARSCGEVVSGIALVTALAIQSQVFEEEVAAAPAPTVPTGPAAAPGAPTTASTPPPTSRPSTWTHDFGLWFGVADGLGPRLTTGVGALWGLGPVSHPSFIRLVADWYDTGTMDRKGGRVRFRLLAGRLEVCPVRLALTRWLVVPACAGVEAGRLTAEGKNVVTGATDHVTWAAAVLAPRVRLELGRGFAEVVAEERFPLVRQSFEFRQPKQVVHEIPDVSFGAAAAVGLRFP
jgi:hypothetical protein